MRRGSYVGEVSGRGGAGYPSIPMQNETLAFLARFSTPASSTYKSALNAFIYRCKAAGVWSLIQDLWITCAAGTQADALRNLINATRDATVSGSPTYSATGGFSNLSASNKVTMPFSTAGLTLANTGFIAAGGMDTSGTPGSTMVLGASQNDAGAVSAVVSSASGLTISGASPDVSGQNLGVKKFIVGTAGGNACNATRAEVNNSAPLVMSASPIVANNAKLTNLLAYGVLPTATAAQVRKVLAALHTFLGDMGVL